MKKQKTHLNLNLNDEIIYKTLSNRLFKLIVLCPTLIYLY